MWHPRLEVQFTAWIIAGAALFGLAVSDVPGVCTTPLGQSQQSDDKPSSDGQAATHAQTESNQTTPGIGQPFSPATEAKPDQRNQGASDANRQAFFKSVICEASATDWLLAFLTYCLVVIGWFQMRSADRTVKSLERAIMVCGIVNVRPAAEGYTVFQLHVGNNGRTTGVLKQTCVAHSATEPTGHPNYTGGTIVRDDSAFGPSTDAVLLTEYRVPYAEPFFVFGYIKYTDIFGKGHTNYVCLRVDPTTEKITVAGPDAWNAWD